MNNTRNRVRLTESKLHSVIKESVKQVLSELDWKTYDSAMRKAAAKKDFDRAGRFGSASKDAFNRDFGTHDTVYDYNYHRDDVPYQTKMRPKDYNDWDGEWVPSGTEANSGWYHDSIEAASDDYDGSLNRIPSDDFSIRRNMRNKIEASKDGSKKEYKWFMDDADDDVRDNDGNVWHDNFSLANARQAARRGLKDTENYLNGNYEYEPNGRGWHLKDKMEESIRRAIRKVLG